MRFLRDNRIAGVADQFLSSIQNFALTLLTARAVGTDEFGAFSIAILIYALLLGISQSGIGDASLLTVQAMDDDARLRNQLASVLTGVLLGTGLGLLLAVAGLLIPSADVRGCLLALAVAMPVLMGHDCARFAFVAAGQGARALAADSLWIALWVVLLLVAGTSSPVHAILLWGLTSAAGLAYALLRLGGPWPRAAELRRLIGANATLRYRLVGEYLAVSAGSQVTVLGFSAVAGLTFGGGVRGAQSLLGPLNTLFNALRIVATPAIAREYEQNGLRTIRLTLRLNAVLVAAATIGGGVLLLVPEAFGRELLGPTWTLARDVLPVMVLHRIITSVAVGPLGTLRAAGWGGRLMVFRGGAEIIGGVLCVVVTILAGPWWGIGLMLATPTFDAISVWYLLRRARRADRVEPVGTGELGVS